MNTKDYRQGAEARKKFERTMTALFRAPKTVKTSSPKKAAKPKKEGGN